MGIGEVFIIGVSLAMDAFSVSVSDGVCLRRLRPRWLFGIAGAFGLFQGLMPLAGYLAGASFAWLVTRFSRPIVCTVLCVIGLKMLWDCLLYTSSARRSVSAPTGRSTSSPLSGWSRAPFS